MRLISVDFQNDFVSPGGVHYRGQPCVDFLRTVVVPFCREHGIVVAEIVSDFRTEGGDAADSTCVPGQWGYESGIPADLKPGPPWVKASIAPTWVRDGGGRVDVRAGPARADPAGFATWLETALGPTDRGGPVVIVDLVLEVCVLATLIEIHLRGYPATVMVEGFDTYDGDLERKLSSSTLSLDIGGRPLRGTPASPNSQEFTPEGTGPSGYCLLR